MGQPESALSDLIAPPRSLAERLRTEVNGHASIEGTAASFMAERFAPELALAAAANDADLGASPAEIGEEPEADHLLTPSTEQASPASRTLLAALIVAALVPTTTLAALFWRGAIDVPTLAQMIGQRDDGTAPVEVQASVASMPAPETILAKRNIELPAIALSLPDTIVAEAGSDAPFGIRLEEMDRLPPRSIVTIRGLPQGTIFSSGRPYGETEWSLRPDETGGLRIALPAGASGLRALNVELVAADGRMIANASTRLEISGDPNVVAKQGSKDAPRVDELMAHGREMVAVGYVAGARSYFRRAAETGSAEATFALGATYDPSFIKEIGAHGIKPDANEARAWYERAKAMGDKDAHAQLLELAKADAAVAMTEAASAFGSTEATEGEWVEVSSPVNVRAAPGPQAEIIKIAQRGARYHATGRQGSWVQVTDPKTSEVGWIYARYVAPAKTPAP